MYESRVTFKIDEAVPQTMVIATASHPEDIANDIWQSLVYDRLMDNNCSNITIVSTDLMGGSSQEPITTEAQLDAAVDALPEAEVREIVKQIATQWFVEDDGSLDIDKALGSDQLEAVTQALTSRGILPTH